MTPHALFTRHTAREEMNRFHGDKVRILIAEDNFTNQQVAMGILKKFGLTADAVANGEEVLDVLTSIPYDLVLMDVQRPVMDGYEATARIRDPASTVQNHDIPVIAMTAHAMSCDREKCLRAGMNDYIAKPVSPNALAKVLAKWLPKRAFAGKGMEKASTAQEEMNGSNPVVWNKAEMMDRLMDDEDLVDTIIQGFLEDLPLQIEKLERFIQHRDVKGVTYQAHTIKGAAANVGGEALQEIAYGIEQAGLSGNVNGVGANMAELKRRFRCLAEELRAGVGRNT